MPVGAYARIERATMHLHGVIGSMDGKYLVKDGVEGNIAESISLGTLLAERLLEKSKAWYTKPL